jgi:hypothetical protein
MTLNELRGHLRVSLLRDSALPYLWQDSELTRYLNDAEAMFARRTFCFTDALSDFTSVVTTAASSCMHWITASSVWSARPTSQTPT